MSEPQVKILDKALRVLMLFSPEQPEWGVSAVSREVGMSKSTVHRILRVLELGVAVINPVTLSGEMATIFHEQVRAVAKRSGVDDAELLGRAVAHEVGHLLLRVREHSPTGIMRGAWSLEELTTNRPEDWQFAPTDRERIQLRTLEVVGSKR